MAPRYSTQFIDAALFSKNPFALSYPDSKQKWLIRKHLLSLIQDYPSFSPSADTFIHNDGTSVNLLNASGDLHVSSYTTPIHLTIWLHENYPHIAPTVFVSSNSVASIHTNHPFVDPSGITTSAYLLTWSFPRYNLTELVRNLVRIFSHDHPFTLLPATTSGFTHPSLASKLEALDRLLGSLHYDQIALLAQIEEETKHLSEVRAELLDRKDITTSIVKDLEAENNNLKDNLTEMMNDIDVLVNWLQVNNATSMEVNDDGNEVAFEADDENSRAVIDSLAADRGVEDLIYALDKAVEQQVLSCDAYIKQVRGLARDQFFNRAMVVKLRGPDFLLCTSFN